ncbi:MAG: hypothetical protein KF725_17465 [Cyclobacteriaceae bacterium]|nr:hypothetical protein [Cyclobacteriaceae bacterium]UYN85276.1 MAG: hypothetical protein KIT51_10245 [Cyclobacteriaceae bacterium]
MKRRGNKGFDPLVIADYKARMEKAGRVFLLDETDDNTDEYAHFYFIGMHEGNEVIFDAVIYTLRLHHESELFELAEHRAARHFPNYKKITYDEDENGNLEPLDDQEEEIGLFMAEVIMELEEDGTVKVKEHVDQDVHVDFGIALDIGLHVDKITPKIIDQFICDFNADTLTLDPTLYSFQTKGIET